MYTDDVQLLHQIYFIWSVYILTNIFIEYRRPHQRLQDLIKFMYVCMYVSMYVTLLLNHQWIPFYQAGQFAEADIFYRMTNPLVGVVPPVPERNIELQRQAELQNYLQFPSREVKIHVVNSFESLEYAAAVLGVSLTEEWSSTSTSHNAVPNPFLAQAAEGTSKPSPDSEEVEQKDVEAEFLHDFLRRRFPPGEHGIWSPSEPQQLQLLQQQQQQQQDVLSRSLGYRNIVGLDSEWRVVMYATNTDRFGCSILQVHPHLCMYVCIYDWNTCSL